MASMILMKHRDQLPEDVIKRIERVQANVDAETSLIGELLELSRIRSEQPRRRFVDTGKLIADLAATFDYELKARGIEFYLSGDMPTLYIDRSRLRQALQNLIDNAIKYMDKPHGGRIEVSCHRKNSYYRFAVADNGPGIEPNQQKKIFCVFRRAESAVMAKVSGKGVGLAVVKTVAAKYNGRAYVKSQPGRGSTFHLDLSVAATQPPQENATEDRERDLPT